MSDLCATIGKLFCEIGGGLFGLLALGVIAYFACAVWIAASNKFRGICKAESMIFEYKKNRDKFLEWKQREE